MSKFFISLLLLASAVTAHSESSILVYDNTTKTSIVEQNKETVRPMASITKLMTAIVSLETYNLQDKIKLSKKTYTTVEDLLKQLLVRSSNTAAEILAKNYPQGRDKFIERMNDRARGLGLISTRFDDPSGLSDNNVTTANELIQLVLAAGSNASIRQFSTLTEIDRHSNTNKDILIEFGYIAVSKTGFTSKAGRCLVMLVDKDSQQYVIIILGEPTKSVRDNVAKNLLSKSFLTNKYFYEQTRKNQIQTVIEQNIQAQSSYYYRPASTWGLYP
jgi:D-alanyl-D-alanine endopeptidase (penicillin-binding protein 7)